MRLFEADPATGETRLLAEERSATQIDLNVTLGMPPNVRVLEDRGEVIWFSERDGWGHLYLYDLADGSLKRQITSGPWLVRQIVHVDEASGTIWFTAGGREDGRDPYYPHLYSIKTDGSGLRLLTREDAYHQITAADSGDFFIDTYSRVDLPSVTVLRSPDGAVVLELEEAFIEPLLATGWQYPVWFKAKAADGVTDIYGVMFRPTDFDPEKMYPVIDDIYPGPQANRVQKTFSPGGESQSLAELGFVVIMVDGRGTPFRSKAFHDFSYRNLQSGGGIDDHIAAFKQLSYQHPYLDLDRVGIYGWSGGGFASVNAMLHHPEFYKVAVSGAGNHDQRSYVALWGEKYHGLPADTEYIQQANSTHAAKLEGKLLLLMPEIDDNVHPTQTVRLIDALIKANKDFDMVLLPGTHHAPLTVMPYITRRRWDYFVEHLLGAEPPEGYRIADVPPKYYARLFQR
jgi:dipeptidyl aminopeptidase/acylaminoacyl peptidase